MKNSKLATYSIIHSIGVLVYVSLVALIMNNGQKWFGNANNILGATAILLLFVLSAAIVGALVLGKPTLLYLDGKKKEAIKLFLYTISSLAIIILIVFTTLLFVR